MSKYTSKWVLEEYIDSLERMFSATIYQLKQSQKSLQEIKKALKDDDSAN